MENPKPPAKIGLFTSTSLVVGNMIASGVFLLPASLAAYGGIGLLGWIGSSAGAIVLALLFSKLSKKIPNALGGPYAYTRAGLGDFAGYLVAWGYWISIWCTNAAIAVAFVSYLTAFLPALAINKIFSFLSLSDVAKFTSLNREGAKWVKSEILIRAEKFGYVGKNENEAKKYLEELYKEVKSVFEFFIWDSRTTTEQFFSFNDDEGVFSFATVRAEESLEKLMQLNPMNLMKILKNRIYGENYKTLRQFFGSEAYLKGQANQRDPSLPFNFYATNFGDAALQKAIYFKDVGIVRLLLENGADPNIGLPTTDVPEEIQQLILARREKVDLVNKLSNAIKNKNLSEVKRLLELGVDPNAKGALHTAANRGSTEIVELLLEHGAQINRLEGEKTPLFYACGDKNKKPNIEIVQLLLEKGADPNIGVLLHNAARNNYVEVVVFLIEFGADVNKLISRNCSALHFACGYGDPAYIPNLKIIELLLQADKKMINQKNYDGMTPLQIICLGGKPNLEVLKLLLENDADPNTFCYRNGESCTPLGNILNNYGSPEIIKLLIDKGARLTEKSSIRLVFSLACGYKGNTPNLELIKYFLDKGINPNFDTDYDGNTPLHVAVQNNAIEIIKLLLSKKAKIKRNDASQSPLYFACLNGNPTAIKLLLENGAKPDLLLLLRAVESGSVESVALLLEKNKKLINEARNGVTPLLAACYTPLNYKENPQMVKFLLENGADPNIRDYFDGKSPLQRNVQGNGSPEIFKLLIDYGAKIELSDKERKKVHSPHRIAKYELSKEEKEKTLLRACGGEGNIPNFEVVKYLLSKGVDPNFSKGGISLLGLAASNGSAEIVKLLLEKENNFENFESIKNDLLHLAISSGSEELIQFLLEKGAGPSAYFNSNNDEKRTPLKQNVHMNGSPKIFKLLVDKGAVINELSESQKLHALLLACGHARQKPNIEVVKLLLDNGVDPTEEKDGLNALMVAQKNNLTEIVELLKNHK